MLSTHRIVKFFGLLALLSFATAYFFFATWSISVWCFFAALLSAIVYVYFVLQNRRDVAKASPVEASPA